MNPDLSLQFAQIIGIVLSISGISLLVNQALFKKLIDTLSKNSGSAVLFRFFGGFIALILGTFMVTVHNYWEKDWTVLVTLFGWLTLFKGVTYLLFPECITKIFKMYQSPIVYKMSAVLALLIGLIFWYFGFVA